MNIDDIITEKLKNKDEYTVISTMINSLRSRERPVSVQVLIHDISEEDYNKPPLGIMPHHIWIDKRIKELRTATAKYIMDGTKIPIEWIEEYNDLIGE